MLAIEGGNPVRDQLFAVWPYFAGDEIEAVTHVLESGKVNYWTGEQGRFFEKEFADFIGVRHAIALANGTVALELALYTLGIGPGDEVVTSSRTFIASASCIVARGATPIIADVDAVSQNISADTISRVITPRTKAIIAVHLAGWPCDMEPILELARAHNIKVIEDCAQAHGALYKERPVGSIGDIGIFSFCQDKILTTGGEGGMLTTDNTAIWQSAWSYKDHGKNYDAVFNQEHAPGYRWVHESFGTNWRLTEMQAAIGRIQLTKLSGWVEKRRRLAAILTQKFSRLAALRVTIPGKEIFHSYYKYYVFLNPDALKSDWTQQRIIDSIVAEGIPCFSGSCSEIYLEKAFKQAKLGPAGRLPTAKQLGETSLMFLVHPTLTETDMQDTCNAMEKVLNVATA